MPNTGNTQQQINYGAEPNDGLGDPLRTAFIKTDENFDNIWLAGPVGSNITITNNTVAVNNTNGNLILQPNGVGIIQTRGGLQSFANNLHYLGTANLRYLGGYFGPAGLDVTGNITAGNISTGGFSTSNLSATSLTVNGDAQITGNLRVQGDIIQVGNIVTDTLVIQLANTAANGSQAGGAGITVGANDDIATLLYDSSSDVWTTNIGLTVEGNVTADYFFGDGSQLINLPDPYTLVRGTTQVTIPAANGVVDLSVNGGEGSYQFNQFGQLTFTDGSAMGNVGGDFGLAAIANSNIAISTDDGTGYRTWTFDITGTLDAPGNISTSGDISAVGNITGNYILGNGAFLTGLPEQYGNANVASYLPTYTGTLAGSNLTINNGGPLTWTVAGSNITAPSGAVWRSQLFSLDDYITSAANGYINLQSLFADGNIASELHLEHGVAQIRVADAPFKDWTFRNTGTLEAPGNIDVAGNVNATNNIRANGTVTSQNLEVTKTGNTWYWNGALMLSPAGGSWFSNPDVQEEYISSGEDGYLTLQSLGAGPGFQIESEINLEHGKIRLGVYNGVNKHWDFLEDGTLDVPGNILPQANNAQSLGNIDLQWAELWVANSTIYLGGVPIGISAGNVLTVGGEPVLSNDSDTAITTTGNITANYFIGDGSQLTNLPFDASKIENGTSNVEIATANGNVTINADGNVWTFDTTGNLATPANLVIGPSPAGGSSILQYDAALQLVGEGANAFVVSGWAANTNAPDSIAVVAFNAPYTNGTGNVQIAVGNNATTVNYWTFGNDGTTTFPMLTVDLHNGGNQAGRVLQFGDDSQQAIITGPTPAVDNNAQRLIIQGQAGNGTGEGGDVYLWGGDAEFNGGDIKIYAGDADNVASGSGGYVNIEGGSGFDNGGYASLRGGQSNNGQGAYAQVVGGYGVSGGDANITGGQGYAGSGGAVNITGGTSGNGLAEYGNVNITAGATTWTFDNTGNLNLPSQGNIVGTTPNNSGSLQWVGNSSGDGYGYTTLVLRPDDTVSADQSIVIDPTAPNHIHIRAGGTQDNSGAQLYLGGENSHFSVGAGNAPPLYLKADNQQWTFGTDGVIYAPGNINAPGATFTGNVTAGIVWANNNGNGTNFRVGDDLWLGDVNVADTMSLRGQQNAANAFILFGNADTTSTLGRSGSGPLTWKGAFTVTGNATVGNILTDGYYYANGTPVTFGGSSYGNSNVATFLAAFGSNSISTTGNVTANNFIGNIEITGNISGTSSNVELVAGVYEWAFDNTGNLILPGNTFSVNYANGTAVSLGSTYGNSNVATLLSAFGSNTISTTGNVTAGNLVTTAKVVASGSVSGSYLISTQSVGDEGGEISLAIPATNTTLQNIVTIDVYQNRLRFFEGSGNSKGAYIDLSACANGVGTNLLAGGGGSYGDSNVVTLLSSFGSNTISTTGNVTAGNLRTTGNSTTGVNSLLAGVTNTILSNTVAAFSANVNSYTQATLQNKSTGADATADWILTADNGSDTVNYGDFGIINSGYDVNTPTNSLGNIVYAADTYIYAQGNTNNTAQSGGNLVIGTTTPTKSVKIFAGGANNSALVTSISNTGMSVTGAVSATGNISAANFIGGSANVQLIANVSAWTFDVTGNLTLPGNTFMVNYANGTPVSLGGGGGGTYGDSNVVTLLSSFGSNTVSTTGNVTGGNLVTTGTVDTYDLYVANTVTVANDVSVTGDIDGAYITASANIAGGNLIVTGTVYGSTANLSSSIETAGNVNAAGATFTGNITAANLGTSGNIYIGGTVLTRTLTVGTRVAPITVPLATNNSFNVLARSGNVAVYTT